MSLGGSAEETQDSLIIFGNGNLKGGTSESFNDHRIAMSAAVASVKSKNTVVVSDAGAVAKSYPSFWEDFSSLGVTLTKEEE